MLTVLLLALLVFGGWELLRFHLLEQEKVSLITQVVQVPKPDQGVDSDDPFCRQIDWTALQAVNPDIRGWIYIPGTGIDYPILAGESDEYYLNRNYRREPSVYGSIFGFAGVDLDTDNHICLFGHNMVSRQMFGSLKDYRDQEYADAHSKMYIYTPKRTKECDLISVFRCHQSDRIFELDKTGDTKDLTGLTAELKARSEVEGSAPEAAGQIYTLSTCSGYTGTAYRLTVHYQVTQEKYIL